MLYAGIDLGTSSVKLVLCDEKGKLINSVTKTYPLSFPREGWAEQNPNDWYEKTLEGLCELVGSRGGELKAVSFGGQMHSLVMLGENDIILRPAILWNDSRSVEECDYLNNTLGRGRLAELTANIAFPGFTAPKILWVRKNEPDVFARCKKILLAKDYLFYKFSGVFASEPSDASGTLLFDVGKKCWSAEMLSLCGIDKSMLPEIYPSYSPCGVLKKELASLLGADEVILAPGAGDNAAAAVGMGVLGEGGCSISLGTSGTVFISSEHFLADERNALHSFAHADGGYHLLGCVLSAASCNKWWMDILNASDYANEQKKIASLGENSIIFLPYLMGERSPINDPYARGAFVGMSMSSSREDMTQAVLEGVAYALRSCVEAAREQGIILTEAFICGGGAKSPLWLKILSNVLRLNLKEPLCGEGAAYGAAILAMTAAGEYPSVRDAAEKIVKVKSVTSFDEETAAKYDKGYARFVSLYSSLKDWFGE